MVNLSGENESLLWFYVVKQVVGVSDKKKVLFLIIVFDVCTGSYDELNYIL